MLKFNMNMPFALMALYGSFMIIIVLLFRAFLKNRLPKFVFPVLWCVILVRLLVPFSLSSPLSIKSTNSLLQSSDFFQNIINRQLIINSYDTATATTEITEARLTTLPLAEAGSAESSTADSGYTGAAADSSSTGAAAASSSTGAAAASNQTGAAAASNQTGAAAASNQTGAPAFSTMTDNNTVIPSQAEDTTVSEGAATYYTNSPFIYRYYGYSDSGSAFSNPLSSMFSGWFSNLFINPGFLIFIYFAGLIITLGILLFQKYHYSQKLKNRLLIEHNETINNILREMNMGHILVFTNDEIASPMVCGLFTPRIYLPTRMDFQNTALLKSILTHEAMHIKHKDNWIKAFMFIALILNWFNPLVWLMSKCLASDLESSCDEAVLKRCSDEEERKSYAFSLLSMAITGNRTTLLYSAFSKTEVEKRIKNILNYKKASGILLIAAVLFMLSGSIVFATGVQAPFYSKLTSFCATDTCHWGVTINITRDISLGKNPQRRAENIVFDILNSDAGNDSELIESRLIEALSEEFHVEKSAFDIDLGLCLSDEEREKEYKTWKLAQDKQGFFIYEGEPVRTYVDRLGGFYQSREEGLVDITINRDKYGNISSITALHPGDDEFDSRSREIELNRSSYAYDNSTSYSSSYYNNSEVTGYNNAVSE